MKIIHYFLGFPPYRTGGLTRYALDLMSSQMENGNKVIAVWPGKIELFGSKVKIKKRKEQYSIDNYEIINALPVPLDEGIKDVASFTSKIPLMVYDVFLKEMQPDIIHIHTLMGLHKEFVEAAKKNNIKLVYTTHDYFGLCPKVTFYSDKLCENDNECKNCVLCNSNALSINKIKILQSPFYRLLKDTNVVKFMRKKHRKSFFDNQNVNTENSSLCTANDYKILRNYYIEILNMIDIIHFNSSVSKKVYDRFITPNKSAVLSISHKNIRDNRLSLKYEPFNKLRLLYLGPIKEYKGFNFIKSALDLLWEDGFRDFELKLYGNVDNPSPYMIVAGEMYDNSKMDEVFQNVDFTLAPSIWFETFGFTVLESLSYGVPVVVTSNVGSKDIIKDAGYIVEPNDVEALCDILKKLDSKKIMDFREKVLKIKLNLWDEFVGKMYKLYESGDIDEI